MPIETHYSILGISRAASTDDIEAAYRAILLANHPDKIKHLDPFQRTLAEARLRAGKTAYEVLIDPKHAKKYDDEMGIWGSFGNAQTWRRPWEPRVASVDASEPVPPRRPAGQGTTSDAEEHKFADAKEEETRPYAGGSSEGFPDPHSLHDIRSVWKQPQYHAALEVWLQFRYDWLSCGLRLQTRYVYDFHDG